MKLTNQEIIRTNFLNLILIVVLTFFSSFNNSIYSQISTLTVECGEPIPSYSPRSQNSTPWCYTFNLGPGQSRMYTGSSELSLTSDQSKFVFNNLPGVTNSTFIAEKTDFIENNDGTALLVGTIVNTNQKDLAFNYAFWLTKKQPNSNPKMNADNLTRQFGINYDNLNEYSIDLSKTNSLTGINGYEGSSLKLTKNENEFYATTTKSKNDEIAVVGNFSFDGVIAQRGIETQVSNLNVNFFSRIKFFVCPIIDPCHQTLVRVCLVYNWHFCIAINIEIITIVDTTPPTFNESLPQDLAVNCPDDIPSAPTLTATDTCTDAEVSFKEVVSGEGCSYEIYRIWTAEDECGNTTVHKQTIVVNDNVPPAFVEDLPADVAVSCDAIPAVPVLTATDNCGSTEVTYKEVNSGEGCSYEIYRIWTAEDECGNTTVHKQTIVVNDNVAPAFVEELPMDMTVECDAIPMAVTLTATDNCGSAELSYKETRTDGNCPSNYTLVRVWTAEDECGNTTVHKQTITVQDTTAPAFVEELPMDMTVECDAVPMAVTLTATDNCGSAEVSYKETRTDGNCPSNYTLVRVWTAEDECGNTTVHKQTITVQDTTAPAFVEELPMDMTVECDVVPMAVTLTATDNCGSASVEYGEVRNNGNCPSNYTLVRTWTAMDECGNTTIHSQSITVQDTTNPMFTGQLPQNVTVECDQVPQPANVTATDNCGVPNILFFETRIDGSCTNDYTLVRLWKATDSCGNYIFHKQTINVQDTTAPTFVGSLPADVAVACDAIPAIPTITATDNCGAAEVTYKEVTSGQGCQYEIYRIWTAEDACGNTTTHKQTIVVSDSVAPTFVESLPADVAVACDAIPAIPTITATDNCSEVEVSYKEVRSNDNDCDYEIYRIWTAEDACGNTIVHKQTIVVLPASNPQGPQRGIFDSNVSFDAYPLPFVDDLTIRYTFDYNSPVQVEVYDLKGRLIHKANDTNGYLNKEYTINLTTVRESSQVYILKVITDRGSETKKIISANR